MKIFAVSDLHGHLPEIPPCDLLLLAGDFCADRGDLDWYENEFRRWVRDIPACGVAAVAGNHDILFERLPTYPRSFKWTYLNRQAVTLCGLSIYGDPFTPGFGDDWAFRQDEDNFTVPSSLDILLLHGPPYGHCDGDYLGSPSLTKEIRKKQPKVVICGHIHEGFGVSQIGRTKVYNVSLCDRMYRPVNGVTEIDIG